VNFSEKNYKLAVCLAVVDSDKKVLVTRRNVAMKIFPHAWVLPGGHVDPGETLEEAVIRELLEETGIEIV
jgi:8-oxo-dGTP diphosphatase